MKATIKMQHEVLPKLKAWISKNRYELHPFFEATKEDAKWVQKIVDTLLYDTYAMSDFIANNYEKQGGYPELEGLHVSEIADLLIHEYLEQCFDEEDHALLHNEIHGYE